MKLEQAMPIALRTYADEDDRYIYFSRSGRNESLELIQFGMHRTPPLYDYGPGVRDHHLIHFVFSGCGDVTLGSRRFHAEGGELFFIPSGAVSYYQADERTPWIYAYLGFDGPWVDALLEETGLDEEHPLSDMRDMAKMYGIVTAMLREMFSPCGYMQLLSGALQLMGELRAGPPARAPHASALRFETGRLDADNRINEVITYLEQHYSKPLSVQALADQMKISRSYLSQQFKKHAGCSIKTYITRLRMERARMFMIDSRLSLRTIAEQCGYDDPLFFSRVFKNTYGLSPKHYRESLWQNHAAPGARLPANGKGDSDI